MRRTPTAICSVDECGKPAPTRGLCHTHYTRWRQHGDPTHLAKKGPAATDPVIRFWRMVNKNGPVPGEQPGLGPCWVWTGGTARGYGAFWDGKRQVVASRFALELKIGPLPEGSWALHRCDNPPCVNNEGHLFAGRHDLNMQDMAVKGRSGRYSKPDRTARGDRSGARTHPEQRPRGEAHYAAKLRSDQTDEIRHRYAAGGISQAALAAEFGVTQTTVSRIVLGKGWREAIQSA